MARTFSLLAESFIIVNCFSQEVSISQGCIPMDIFLLSIYPLLLNIDECLSQLALWVCMSMSFILIVFMGQGRSPNRPKDGNAECVLLQGKVLLSAHVCVVPQWHIVNR